MSRNTKKQRERQAVLNFLAKIGTLGGIHGKGRHGKPQIKPPAIANGNEGNQ